MLPPPAYISRPKISIDGQSMDGISLDLISLLVEETTEGLYRCEARLNNYGLTDAGADYLYFGRDTIDFGKDWTIRMGPGDQARQIFKGRISGIEGDYPEQGGAQTLILAEDRLQDLRMTRRTRTFEDVSDEEVIQQIANEHSLTPRLSLNGPTHKVIAQVNQSDLAFVRERARTVNAEVWVDSTTLYAKSRTDREGDAIDLAYGVNLLSFSVKADLAHQCTEVGVSGWDVSAKDAIEEIGEQNAISSELNGDTSGGLILQQAFSARKERVVQIVPLTSAEARSIAQARYRERARRFVTGSGVADGDPRIRVGSVLNLLGLGDLFSGKYYVVTARHTYDLRNGYRTEFDLERPGIGQPQS